MTGYDDGNIFARILAGDIPCDKVLETEHSLAFADIAPQAPAHVLVIPKGRYADFAQFAAEASGEEIVDYVRAIGAAARDCGVAESEGGAGFRLIANAGPDSRQEVPHLHVHVLGGRPLGRMLEPSEE